MSRTGRSSSSWRASLALGVAVSLVFLWLTFRKVDLAGVEHALERVSLPILALALLTRGAAFLALALRTRMTTSPAGKLRFRSLLVSHLIGYTGNNVLPLRLGELLRIDYLSRAEGPSRSFLLGTTAVERLLDALVLLALFALTVPTVVGASLWAGSYPILVAVAVAALVVALLVVRWKGMPALAERVVRPLHPGLAARLAEALERGAEGLGSLFHARWGGGAFGATLLYWLCSVGSVWIILSAFGMILPWYAPFLVVAVTALGTALPSSPAFVGTYDYFSALGVSMLGVGSARSASFAIVAHAMAVVPYSLVGLVVLAKAYPGRLGLDTLAAAADDPGSSDPEGLPRA